MRERRGPTSSCTGQDWLRMFSVATRWLEANAESVNALNVYPVPDGDTGTNMVLTLHAALRETSAFAEADADAVARSMAHGALMGARGNSGVILSQYIGGLATGLKGKQRVTAPDLAQALQAASEASYKAMSNPVEGTILTVGRAAAQGAVARAEHPDADLVAILAEAVLEAKTAVQKTPDLLPVLKEAGVVDAGGEGLYLLLQGALAFLRGEELEAPPPTAEKPRIAASWFTSQRETALGFCTEFVLTGPALSADRLRQEMARFGESESIVGDDKLVRVHLHAQEPEAVLAYARSVGEVEQVSVRDMNLQHQQFLATHTGRGATLRCGAVAVAPGSGFAKLMRSLGASAVVWGGQTMNPSTEDILNAVEAIPAPEVIVLPNNKNIVPTARQAQSVTGKAIHVLSTVSLPQGIAALVAFNAERGAPDNLKAMEEAIAGVRTAEVTYAVRSTRLGGVEVEAGDVIALVDGKLVLARKRLEEVMAELPDLLGVDNGSLLTLYFGEGVSPEQAEETAQALRAAHAGLEVEVAAGGQPHYPYILSLE
ncbi:MAG: DAK2 domain-containing protein [Chloroflexi bacterium]|nr:DAK2 domain-containing protein [Chloroflexota bacterium]